MNTTEADILDHDHHGLLVARASSPLLQHAGWRSRGYLPHFDSPEAVPRVVFRLADALPLAVMAAVHKAPSVERMAAAQAALDSGHGDSLLAEPRVAESVEQALLHFDGHGTGASRPRRT